MSNNQGKSKVKKLTANIDAVLYKKFYIDCVEEDVSMTKKTEDLIRNYMREKEKRSK